MATILQLNRIATNRSGAVDDTVARLQSSTSTDAVNINPIHLPLGNTLPVVNGMIQAQPQAVNLSDVHAFSNATERNAGLDINNVAIDWHEGDIAVLAENEDFAGMTVPGPITQSRRTTDSTTIAANTTFIQAEGSGVGRGEFLIDIGAPNTTVPYTPPSPVFISPNADGSESVQITVVGNNGLFDTQIRLDLSNNGGVNPWAGTTLAPIYIVGASTTSDDITVASGTWVYVGADATGPTENDAWLRLEAPGTSADLDQLATISDGTGTPNRITTIEYSATDSELTFTDTRNTNNTIVVPLGAGGALVQSESVPITGAAATGVTYDDAANPMFITSITPVLFVDGTGAALTEFPTKNTFMLFANGMKIVNSEIDITNNVITFINAGASTTPNGISLATGSVVFELVTF